MNHKNLMIFVIFLLGICWIGNNHAASEKTTSLHPNNWKTTEIPKLLKEGRILSIVPMRKYLESCGKKTNFEGDVFLVHLDNGLKAVFKGSSEDDLGDAHAEVAAYRASIELGFPHIPPTIITEIQGRKGSFQLFVETKIDCLDSDSYKIAMNKVSFDDISNMRLFYFVFGQWDTGPHNMLIFEDEKRIYPIAIDNSGLRNRQYVKYGHPPFVRIFYIEDFQTNDWGNPFPYKEVKIIRNPTKKNLMKIFKNILPNSFYQSFKSYDLPFYYVIFQNSLWRQFHAEDPEFVISFTDRITDTARRSLEILDLTKLKRIFRDAEKEDFLTDSYLKSILERRDQVLNYFKK